MRKEHIDILRRAGDWYALQSPEDVGLETLNPYHREDGRIPAWRKVQAVEALLALIAESSGQAVADDMRKFLDFRAEVYPEGDAYINGLDDETWLLYADMVLIRALEVQRDPAKLLVLFESASEVARRFDLTTKTVTDALQAGRIRGRQSGKNWIVYLPDAQRVWGGIRKRHLG